MNDEAKKVAQVVNALTGKSGAYDNPKTDLREFWTNGKLTHERPRAGCDGTIFSEWGTFAKPL